MWLINAKAAAICFGHGNQIYVWRRLVKHDKTATLFTIQDYIAVFLSP
jgi:hypothetical protein